MKLIPLSQTGRVHSGRFRALVDDDDYEWLAAKRWAVRLDRTGVNPIAYAYRTEQRNWVRTNIRMHRAIWERAFGPISAGMEVDHIEHGEFGGLDNRRSNLRIAPHDKNRRNGRMHSNNTSGFRGAYLDKSSGRWFGQITILGSAIRLGTFDTAEEAARAYDAAARDRFGEFARPNFREAA